MKSGQSNLRRYRDRFLPEIQKSLFLTARDIALLKDLFEHRIMSRGQIIGLGYFRSVSRANLRLRALFDHGLVRRTYLPLAPYGSQALYGPGKAAPEYLASMGGFELADLRRQARQVVSPLALMHTLKVVDFRLLLLLAQNSGHLKFERWLPERSCEHVYQVRIGQGKWERRAFKPDAYVRLHFSDPRTIKSYFVEIDLGHVSASKFTAKVKSYIEYKRLGLYSEAYGARSFEVLVVTSGERRLAHLADLAHGKDCIFRFTTFSDLALKGFQGRIWRSSAEVTGSEMSLWTAASTPIEVARQ